MSFDAQKSTSVFVERHIGDFLSIYYEFAFFRNIKSVQLEDTRNIKSHYVRDEGGRLLLQDKGRIRGR